MMERFRDLSIQHKLTVTVTITAFVALVLASAAFLARDVATFRDAMVRRVSVLAQIIGINTSAALAFQDAQAAQEVLAALSAEEDVLAAAIYGRDGTIFAQYRREGALTESLPARARDGFEFVNRRLALFHPVAGGAEAGGTVYVLADTRELRDRVVSFVGIALVVLLVASGVGVAIAARLQRLITRPLDSLVRGSEAMAAGDLSVEVPVESRDELGALASSFNEMTRRLRDVVGQVRENGRAVAEVTVVLQGGSERVAAAAHKQEAAVETAAESVASVIASIDRVSGGAGELAETASETSSSMIELDASIAEIAGNMDRLAEAIETSSSSVVQLTTSIQEVVGHIGLLSQATGVTEGAIHELHGSVQQVGQNAGRSREISETAQRDAQRGRASVQQTIEAMNEIKSGFADLEKSVSRLASKSDSIGAIVKVIEEVADETNLLSLNAAIIASQSGEHGRAFAVVASAVKELAERTARSTREIADLVQSVQAETALAVQAVGRGASRVDRGVTLSIEAGEVLHGIMAGSEEAGRMVQEIGQAADRQGRDLAEVDRAVVEVRGSVEQVARAIREQEASSGEIRRSVERIRNLGQEVKRSTSEQSRGTRLIAQAAERVNDMVREMLEATNEQTKRSEQIRTALQIFREVTVESARTAEEIQGSVTKLVSRSGQLEQEIGRLKA